MDRKDPRTALRDESIWHNISENVFRLHLVELEKCTNAVPTGMQTFPVNDWLDRSPSNLHTLPLSVEQQFADDFAYLSAVEEGAQSVAAACVEEHIRPPGLVIRFAALDMSMKDTTRSALQAILELLARGKPETETQSLLCQQVVQLHFVRLLARLRSVKWQKPAYLSKSHKKALWQDFANLTHRVQFIYTKKESVSRRSVERQLQELAELYETFEYVPSESVEERVYMQRLIQQSFEFCTNEEIREYAQRLQSSIRLTPTKQVGAAVKTFRQIEKIAAYWRISLSLVQTARKYPSLFRNIKTDYLTPYKSIPTTIGYEAWAKTCHVHAEVQLTVYYDTLTEQEQRNFHLPRAIGTSKYLCYLCYHFLRAHQRFFPSNTHGRLYDQWTVPDLTEFEEPVRQRYRIILEDIDGQVVSETKAVRGTEQSSSRLVKWRPEPMTSRQNLLNMDAEDESVV